MGYEKLATRTLRKLADDLRYDSQHKMEDAKRGQAKIELMKVEAEIKNREGFRGIVRKVKQLMRSNS